MDAEAIAVVTPVVVGLTQLVKRAGLPDGWAPAAVFLLAALGVGVWAFSHPPLLRVNSFDLFAGWVLVATSAAGVYSLGKPHRVRPGRHTEP